MVALHGLARYRCFVVASSGGKDSLDAPSLRDATMLREQGQRPQMN